MAPRPSPAPLLIALTMCRPAGVSSSPNERTCSGVERPKRVSDCHLALVASADETSRSATAPLSTMDLLLGHPYPKKQIRSLQNDPSEKHYSRPHTKLPCFASYYTPRLPVCDSLHLITKPGPILTALNYGFRLLVMVIISTKVRRRKNNRAMLDSITISRVQLGQILIYGAEQTARPGFTICTGSIM